MEEEGKSRSVQSREVDKSDPCSLCSCCRAKRMPADERTEDMRDKVKNYSLMQEMSYAICLSAVLSQWGISWRWEQHVTYRLHCVSKDWT
ncbi:hypothetical protein WJX75_001153 [Coccomyxa subellipsoidea]|uniref:Uncharacterized protein n=1 Tax=Coccomyxa subellipsoidea TaxID=248742 RepID=A0ABR2YAX5_9CHLO